ncbi:DNA-binding protein [Variovorax soli]|jgi:hypothetical protein|uniref:DNA-binding protein n=1 Tax=Variovorax soli TaxID=376815 RepID=UPI0008397C25|nr:DNA-binding protein [Variovorax soli]
MNQVVTEFRGRGIQQSDVFAAADALLAEGLRPTIERVRQKIGRGSPNTVSPMLERWFSTLSARMAGRTSGVSAIDEDDPVPAAVHSAAQLLWDTARREAQAHEESAQASAHEDLRAREAGLVEAQATLTQREVAFAQTRSGLDAALAAAQQVAEALRLQLQEQAQEARRVRGDLEGQVLRLNGQVGQLLERHEAARQAHDQAIAIKDQDLRQAEERHVQQHQRMLLEVDRARQATKSLEAVLAQEQQRRVRGEEGAAQRLAAAQDTLQQMRDNSRATEAALRSQLAAQAVELTVATGDAASTRQEIETLHIRLEDEKRTHDATRALLAQALATSAGRRDGRGTDAPRSRRAPGPGGSAT